MRQGRVVVRAVALAVTIILASVGLTVLGGAAPAQALSGSLFQPGNIISDQNMFNANAMSQAQIQSFLQSEIGSCGNGNCLNVLQVSSTSRAASASPNGTPVCSAYAGSSSESAAAVLFKVQQACGISAKALLVILQKEEGLVTSQGPSTGTLERAMGYGCPDSAGGACSSLYDGFYNQIYWAAWQLQRYGTSPAVGNYQPGVRAIQFSPNTDCGSANVNILNRATAALYNYTPYQPNAAALANLSGTGDGCSSYGNRNFWVYYSDWFGSPDVPPGTPEGSLASVTPSGGKIGLTGWVVDPDDVTATVAVSIQVDSNWYALNANQSGVDLSGEYPGAGGSHYFSGQITATPGTHTMCIYLINAGGAGGTGTFGCQQIVVPTGPPPVGGITSITAANGVISYSGWAVDPDQPTVAVPVAIDFNGAWSAATTGDANTTAPTQFSGAGPNQGFHGTLAAPVGLQTICAWAASPDGPAAQIGCRSIGVPAASPTVVSVDPVTSSGSSVSVSGWAVWPGSVSTSVAVAVNIGSNWYGLSANQASVAAASAVPGSGPNHGFVGSIPLSPGTYSVCVWVAQPSSAATNLGCQTVTATPGPPVVGAVQVVSSGVGGLHYSGWAVDPSAPTAPVTLAANIGSAWIPLTTGDASTVAQGQISGAGANQGFSGLFPVAVGTYPLCVWASSSAGTVNLGCQTATVNPPPGVTGAFSAATGVAGALTVSGWAAWPSAPTTPVPIAANVGTTWTAITSNLPNSLAQKYVVGAGADQGFSGTVVAPSGSQQVCIWAAQQTGPPVMLGCLTATVS